MPVAKIVSAGCCFLVIDAYAALPMMRGADYAAMVPCVEANVMDCQQWL